MEWKSFLDEQPEKQESGWLIGVSSNESTYTVGASTQNDLDWFNQQNISYWCWIPGLPKPKKTYPAPKVGTVVTKENLNEFLAKYSFWFVIQGVDDGYYLTSYNGVSVSAYELQRGNNLPYKVKRVEDTDEITWVQEEL